MGTQLRIDILGWIGGIVLITALGLNSIGKIASTGRSYHIMNLIAAIFSHYQFLVLWSLWRTLMPKSD